MVVLPPAAAIFEAADPENLWAVTCTATSISPSPSTLTRLSPRTAPAATVAAADNSGSDYEEDDEVDALFAELGAGVGPALARAL